MRPKCDEVVVVNCLDDMFHTYLGSAFNEVDPLGLADDDDDMLNTSLSSVGFSDSAERPNWGANR